MRLNQNLLVACSALLIGCSSSPSEFEEEVTFTSTPDRAMVEIDGVRVGRTPIRVVLDRTRNHEVIVGKSGYEVKQTVLRPGLRNGDFGFGEDVKFELAPDNGAPNDIPEEDMAAFNRAKVLADAPFGADPAIYGTLEGDLIEAKQAAERLSVLAVAARKNVTAAQERLAKVVADAKAQAESGAVQATTKLESSESALKSALADAKAAEEQADAAQKVVAERIAFLESLKAQGQPEPKAAVEEVAAAKANAEVAEQKLARAQTAVAEATAALNAAAEAKAKAAQGLDATRIEALTKSAEANRNTSEELAARIEISSRVIAARVEELAKQIAEGKAEDATTVAALEAARKENAELNVQLAAARNAEAQAAAAEADKSLAGANEKVVSLEQKLAEARLAVEAKDRENRARTYAEYTARKGLLERRLRTGELSKDGYAEALAELDKELRNR